MLILHTRRSQIKKSKLKRRKFKHFFYLPAKTSNRILLIKKLGKLLFLVFKTRLL